MDQKSPEAFRTISEVAEWLGVPTHVLRFWESRFAQVKPVKRAGGRRYYRPSDMELLGGIRKLLHDDGMTIRGVQKLLREEGVKYVAAMSPALDVAATTKDVSPSNVVDLTDRRATDDPDAASHAAEQAPVPDEDLQPASSFDPAGHATPVEDPDEAPDVPAFDMEMPGGDDPLSAPTSTAGSETADEAPDVPAFDMEMPGNDAPVSEPEPEPEPAAPETLTAGITGDVLPGGEASTPVVEPEADQPHSAIPEDSAPEADAPDAPETDDAPAPDDLAAEAPAEPDEFAATAPPETAPDVPPGDAEMPAANMPAPASETAGFDLSSEAPTDPATPGEPPLVLTPDDVIAAEADTPAEPASTEAEAPATAHPEDPLDSPEALAFHAGGAAPETFDASADRPDATPALDADPADPADPMSSPEALEFAAHDALPEITESAAPGDAADTPTDSVEPPTDATPDAAPAPTPEAPAPAQPDFAPDPEDGDIAPDTPLVAARLRAARAAETPVRTASLQALADRLTELATHFPKTPSQRPPI